MRSRVKELEARIAELEAQLEDLRQEAFTSTENYRRTSDRFRDFIKAGDQFVFEINRHGQCLFISDQVFSLLGWHPNELSGRSLYETIVHPDDIKSVRKWFDDLCISPLPFRRKTIKALSVDGRSLWLQMSGTAIWNEEQKFQGFRGAAHDISEQKEIEMRLRESEERYELAIEGARLGIWDWNFDTGRFFLSPEIADALGVRRDNLQADNFFDLLEERSPVQVRRALADSLKTNDHIDCEIPLSPEEDCNWVYLKGRAFINENGMVYRLAGSISDISKAKKSEQKVQTQYTQLSTLIERLPGAILVENERNEIVLCNQQLLDLFEIGGNPSDLIGFDCLIIIESAADLFVDPDAFKVALDNCLRERMPKVGEEFTLKSGQTLLRDFVPVMVDGQYRGHLWHYRDITAEKTRREELVAAKAEAEAATESKSRFLANMSHEIRTPLNGVIGMTRLLLENELIPAQRLRAETIFYSASTLRSLLDDILDFSKIEADELELDDVPFEPCKIIDEVFRILSERAREKAIDLQTRFDDQLNYFVRGDPGRLRQVLLNLGDNAIKYTEQGYVLIGVQLVQQKSDEVYLEFFVQDSGIGIPHSRQKAIFEPYTQARRSDARNFGGTGLGLAISKHLIELMGASLELSSEPNKGSTFSFVLPMLPAGPSKQWYGNEKEKDKNLLDGRRLLLVEDNSINRMIVEQSLESYGVEIETAKDGQQGLAMALATSYDFILMDVQMPIMDGVEVTRRLRQKGCRTPIIAITANAVAGDRERYLDAGMNGYVSKPFEPDELIAELSGYSAERAASPESPESAPLEWDRIVALFGSESVAAEVVEDFLTQSTDLSARIAKALQDRNYALATSLFHQISGTAYQVGAKETAEAAATGETAGKGNDFEKMETALSVVQNSFEIVRQLLYEKTGRDPKTSKISVR